MFSGNDSILKAHWDRTHIAEHLIHLSQVVANLIYTAPYRAGSKSWEFENHEVDKIFSKENIEAARPNEEYQSFSHTRKISFLTFTWFIAKRSLLRSEEFILIHVWTNSDSVGRAAVFLNARCKQKLLRNRDRKDGLRRNGLYVLLQAILLCDDTIQITDSSKYVSKNDRCCA